MLLVASQCLFGCSLLISTAIDATGAALGAAGDAYVASTKEDMAKENYSFVAGMHTEQFVKSKLEPNGKPDKEIEFKDTIPAKKIVIYDRTWKGTGYKLFLFAFDKDKKEYVFWDWSYPSEETYKKAMKSEGVNKYFKASWFVDTLCKMIDHNEKIGKQTLANTAAIKLLEEKSEYEELNSKEYNDAAWFLATTKDPRFRDADNAIKFSIQAVEYAKKINNPVLTSSYLDTLAAAYAEKGDYAKALEIETEAYNIANDKKNNVLLEHLNQFKTLVEVYKTGKSYAMWKYGEKK
jgi:tetratricopeptide (TPR) repeat protein